MLNNLKCVGKFKQYQDIQDSPYMVYNYLVPEVENSFLKVNQSFFV